MLDDLSELVKSEAIPFLDRIVSPMDVTAARDLHKGQDTYVQQTIAFGLARAGRIIEAIERLSRLEETLNDQIPWQRILSDDCRLLSELLMSNPGKAQAQLDEWQVENAAALRLAATGS